MLRIDWRSILTAGVAATALAACSGDDDSNTPTTTEPTITPENAGQLTAVVSSIGGLLDIAGAPTGMIGGVPAAGFSGKPGGPEVIDCTDGGTLTITVNDTRPIDELSPGDSVDFTFADCSEDGSTINGSFGFTVDAAQQTKTNVTAGLSFFVTGLTIVDSGTTVTEEGTLTESVDLDTTTGDFGYTLGGFFDASYSEGEGTLTSNLHDLDLGLDYFAEMDVEAIRFGCTYETNLTSLPSYTVATLADFVSYGDSNPTEGRASIASANDVLYINAQEDGVNVLLELDQGNDGTIDWTHVVPWDEL